MAYLTADATLAEIRTAYRTYANYDLEGSVASCKYYIQSLRFLIDAVKDETRQGASALRDQALKYEKQLASAIEWLRANDATFAGASGGEVTFADLREMRS